jgi:predicted component of type VI protein secretion system
VTALRSVGIVLASVAGLVTGWVLAQRYLERHQAALFSPKRRRRHAALGYLVGHPDPETLRVLRDYLAWERHPVLRRRARRVVRELEHALG